LVLAREDYGASSAKELIGGGVVEVLKAVGLPATASVQNAGRFFLSSLAYRVFRQNVPNAIHL
jgi:hypothetical protein